MFTKSYSIKVKRKNKISIESNNHIFMIKLKSYIIKLDVPIIDSSILFLKFQNKLNNICNPNEILINNNNEINKEYISADTISIKNPETILIKNDNFIDYIIQGSCCFSNIMKQKFQCPMYSSSRYRYELNFSLIDENGKNIEFNEAYFVVDIISH